MNRMGLDMVQCLRRESQATASTSSPTSPKDPDLPPSTAPLLPTSSVRQKLGKLSRHLSIKFEFDFIHVAVSCCKGLYASMSVGRVFLAFLLLAAIVCALVTLPVEDMLKSFILWLKHVGPWGPLIMAFAYIPLNILALPGSILTLGGGYVFGLLVGFTADSIGSTAGATAAFLVGKTLCRQYVTAKLKEYPQFQVITHAISKSGFKIVLLLRLVPILPMNVMNYVLSVTPISVTSYVLASWLGMMPVTFAFVYLGTTIKDISEIGSPEAALGPAHWWMLGFGLVLTVLSTILITKVAKDALEKAIEEHDGANLELGGRSSDPLPAAAVLGNRATVPSKGQVDPKKEATVVVAKGSLSQSTVVRIEHARCNDAMNRHNSKS